MPSNWVAINANYNTDSVTIPNGGTVANKAFDFGAYTRGSFVIPAGSGITALAFKSSPYGPAGPFFDVSKADGSGVLSLTVAAGRVVPFPPELSAEKWIQVTATPAVGANYVIFIQRKS